MNFNFLKQFPLTSTQFVKLCVFGGLVLFTLIALSIFQNSWMNPYSTYEKGIGGMSEGSSGTGMPFYENRDEYSTRLSLQNVTSPSMPPAYDGYASESDAEAFEIKNYSASIETRNLMEDCNAISDLKSRTDVIFVNGSEYDRGCAFTFKVEKRSVDAILSLIKDLDPKELSENTHTIKREVEDYTSEIQIYQNKLDSLDETLSTALASYENITLLATQRGDVESLAKIIESKLLLIERLTNARIDAQNQLAYITRAKVEAIDQLEYTYFNVNVYESKYADWEALHDSWKMALKQFVHIINQFAQEMSIGLVVLLVSILKFAVYGVILLLTVKFGWKFVRNMWQR